MGNITSYPCDYQRDRARLMDFWLDCRANTDIRMYPTMWRIRLLLTSRVGEPEKDARIWEDTSGKIAAFAMLWRRKPTSPYLVLDCFTQPSLAKQDLLLAILQWGDQRAYALAREQGIPLTLFASGFSQHPCSAKPLSQYHYEPIPPHPEEHNLYFARSIRGALLLPALPAGYDIRRIYTTDDLASYQALHGFAKVNPLHLIEQLESGEYCHVVAANAEGELVAYCECSICRPEWDRTGQRIGWIDYIETSPEHQKKGLGRAILVAGLSQLQAWGAEAAMLVTVNTNLPAISVYHRAGFAIIELEENPVYRKEIPSD